MTKSERIRALSDVYTRLVDTLDIERMILAATPTKFQGEQRVRCAAIERCVEGFEQQFATLDHTAAEAAEGGQATC